jgi:hypothetical protein
VLGTFVIAKPAGYETDQGAVRVTFANGSAPVQSAFGVPAFKAPAQAQFGPTEQVTALQVATKSVAFSRKSSDWQYTAARREGTAIILTGTADPRRSHPNWVVAGSFLTCQQAHRRCAVSRVEVIKPAGIICH